ncbi:phosphate acyltransferase PlsX [candidate division KSB1 bacterium]|nr:phosphate acyltransferase PlsX [candidate division KSB1 bacterium]
MIKIALDAMGGDNAPHDVVHGGIEAARLSRNQFEVVLVGNKESIEQEISRHFHTANLPISIVHASQAVSMHEQPANALKMKDSSISVSIAMLKDHKVDAFVSAGNTGAVMASALFGLKRIKGIRRPAIGSMLPTETGTSLLIDAGANVDCRPLDLLQFAIMGSIYYSRVYAKPDTTVGLLSIGHEDSKGNEVVIKANELFKDSSINFIGNIEGGDILRGKVHVVACDGFVGNIVLKVAESLHGLLKFNLKRFIRKYFFSQIGAMLMKPTFEGIKKVFDYQEYGGAPLLGVDGNCIIAHGRSTPRAIKNAVLVAYKMVIENVNGHITETFNNLHFSNNEN